MNRSTGPTQATRNGVLQRDMLACQRCGRRIDPSDYSLQHRRPRGSGGSSEGYINLAENLTTLCGSATTGCHGWVTHNETEARRFGWAVSLNATAYRPDDVPILGRDRSGLSQWFLYEGLGRIPIDRDVAIRRLVAIGVREET